MQRRWRRQGPSPVLRPWHLWGPHPVQYDFWTLVLRRCCIPIGSMIPIELSTRMTSATVSVDVPGLHKGLHQALQDLQADLNLSWSVMC